MSRKQVARLMKKAGLKGVCRRSWPATTEHNPSLWAAEDLAECNFEVSEPNRLWVADITYVPVGALFLYLAVVIDAFSRRVIGWAMKPHLRTELVIEALQMAIERRQPRGGVIHHSDRGCQYTSIEYGKRCRLAGLRPSLGSVGDCYHNALCESFFATLECELIDRSRWSSFHEAPPGSLRLYQRLLQPPPPALGPRVHLARYLRKRI